MVRIIYEFRNRFDLMPICRECIHIDLERNGCGYLAGRTSDSPTRTCCNAIADQHVSKLRGDILEVGYGKNQAPPQSDKKTTTDKLVRR